MSETENRQMVEKLYEALNDHDLERYLEFHDESYVLDTDASPTALKGLEATKQHLATIFQGFPDLRFTVDELIATGDHVVTRWQATGTHEGEFQGIPATNRPVTCRGCSVSEVRNGRLVKTSLYSDQLGLLRQLGIGFARAAAAGN